MKNIIKTSKKESNSGFSLIKHEEEAKTINNQRKINYKVFKTTKSNGSIRNKKFKKVYFKVFKVFKSNKHIMNNLPKDMIVLPSKICHYKRIFLNNHTTFLKSNKISLNLNNDLNYYLLDKQISPNSKWTMYRGVSKNGAKFQVLSLIKGKKRYIGSYDSAEEAARAYDKVTIQFHKERAKTNYQYTLEEFESILNEELIYKIKEKWNILMKMKMNFKNYFFNLFL